MRVVPSVYLIFIFLRFAWIVWQHWQAFSRFRTAAIDRRRIAREEAEEAEIDSMRL